MPYTDGRGDSVREGSSMTYAEELAGFATQCCFDDLSDHECVQLKIRILDSLECAIGAMDAKPVKILREQISDSIGGCTPIGGRVGG